MLLHLTTLILHLAFTASQVCHERDVTGEEVAALLSELVVNDVNGGGEDEVVVNFQGEGLGDDNSPDPLFTSVSERIKSAPTFKALEILQAQFIADTSYTDPYTLVRLNAANAFLDAVMETDVMKSAWQFLIDADRASKNMQAFKQQVFDLWFTSYNRDGTDDSSSGFEHVFAGEAEPYDLQVEGFHNWHRLYFLEQANQANYYGYESKGEGVGMEATFEWNNYYARSNGFSLGTSPEFDLAALTVCALAYDKDKYRPVDACYYMKNGFRVVLDVQLGKAADDIDVIWSTEYYLFDDRDGSSRHRRQKATKQFKQDVRLQKLIDDMWAADEDKPTDYQLNWGNPQSGNKDTSMDPLISYLNEEIFKKEQYVALNAMYNAGLGIFTPHVCTAEHPMTGFRKQYIKTVFDTFTSTPMFQLALKYLQDIGKATDWTTFRSEVWALWMGTYSRCNTTLGSSGFEHVFCGEYNGTTLQGQHSWVKYYRHEKIEEIDYHGFYDYSENLMGTFQYTWEGSLKNDGGISFATSPAFDFSVFTVCSLTAPGCNACKFNLAGSPVSVTSYTQPCTDGTCLTTAYMSV